MPRFFLTYLSENRPMSKVALVITSRERDLGGFTVRRILPYATHRMVGPFIFFDHMGPANFAPGQGMTVRPHPHIHLATVTYLFEGKIEHRDSLGFDQLIEPGAINWMTAGHGIVHSERSPPDFVAKGGRLNGIQLWVALPREFEDSAPSFVHHPSDSLPSFTMENVDLRLLLGSAFGLKSPVQVHSNLFYLEGKFPAGSKLEFPTEGRETALYLVEGRVRIDGTELEPCSMAVLGNADSVTIEALGPSRMMLLGGTPVGERFIFWNFVSSSEENIAAAATEWKKGPGGKRFPRIPGDDREFIPLPEDQRFNPKGTIL